ncbi:MAG: hypothetical protein P8J59_01700 [Phycisphaerales bacterium]|nr:hypothetical protein [Phycisphaerales bacterium]
MELGLVVVGADPERAESAGDVLSEAATRHLDRPLPVVATVRRLDVVEGSQRLVFDESVRRSTKEVVSAIRTSLDLAELRPEVAVRSDEEGDAPPESPLQAGGLRLAGFDEPKDILDEAPEERSPAFGRRATDTGAMQPLFPEPVAAAEISRPRTSFRSVRLRPAPIGAPGEPAFVAEEEPGVDVSHGGSDEMDRAGSTVDLVPSMESPVDGFVGLLPELQPTGLRCPIASGVEFAADASGTVHVLCSDAELESARIADAWLHGNRELIASATDFSGVSMIHVFTSDAPRVADLHRTGLRLHLVIEDGADRRSVPLNSERNSMIPV